MADRELGHVIPLFPQGNEIVVYPRLVLARVIEVEVLRLHVVGRQLLRLELGYIFQKALLVRKRHAPDHHRAVLEEEDFGSVDMSVEVRVVGR